MIEILKPAPGALRNVPTTFNYQSPLGFRFYIKRLPEVNFFVQKVTIPGITLPAATEATPELEIPQPGDHVLFEPLVLEFKLNEGLTNYIELHKWIRMSSGGKEYGKFNKNPEYTGYGIKSDILVSLQDSQKNAIIDITYQDAFPVNITPLMFDATLTDVPFITATCTFRYSQYLFTDSP